MKKEKMNTLIILFTMFLYLMFYSCKIIYNQLYNWFVLISISSSVALIIVNRKTVINNKTKYIILIQALLLLLCKLVTNTGIGSIIQVMNLLLVVICLPHIKVDKLFYKTLKILFIIFPLIFLFIEKKYMNPNFISYIYLCCYIINVINFRLEKKENTPILLITSIITLLIIYKYECRTAMLGVILFLITLKLPIRIKKNKKIEKSLPYILVFGSFLIALIYILLWRVGFNINMKGIINKNLYSGRNRIWFEILPLIFKNPILGVGSKYALTSHSAYALHNTVFMLATTFGIPTLIIIFINIKTIINKIYILKSKNTFKLAFAAITTLLIVDIFESYIYWSNFNYLFFIIMIAIFNLENIEKKSKSKIYIFEEGIDRMGGVERVISTLANGLSKKYEVEVVSFYKTAKNTFFHYEDGIKINYLSKNKKQKSKTVKFHSIKYYIYRIIEILEEKIKLENKISKVTSNITHNDIIILGRLEVALHVIPYVDNAKKVIVRDAIHYPYYRKGMQRKIRHNLPYNINTLIVSSKESKDIYENIFKGKDILIKKIYNPLGIEPKKQYTYQNKTIVSVGRYSSQKGFENLIKAFKIVNTKKQDWKLKIIGAKSPQLLKLIKDEKLEKTVELIENSTDVVEILNSSSIYVMTSRYEGYANALVEAMACGIPSITYNWLLGTEEIIDDEKDGKIVKLSDRYKYARGIDNELDIENLATAILELIDNNKLCDKFSCRSSEKIIKTRNKDAIIKNWEKEMK